jgi:hypothetical protein
VDIRLRDEDYSAPTETPYSGPNQRAEYLRGHRAGWAAFADGMDTTLTEDGYQRGSLVGLSAVRPASGTEAELAGFDAGFGAAAKLNTERVLQFNAEREKPAAEWESPVGDPERLDIIATKKDGSVCVMVVAARKLDPDDPRTARVLEAKLRNYCHYIKHQAFADEFGEPTPDRVKLAIRCDWEVPEAYIELLVRVAKEERVPAGLEIRYE